MQTYEGYFENDRFIPLGTAKIPNNKRVILTVLDEKARRKQTQQSGETPHAKAWREFFEAINECDEEIPETFERVNFNREIDL